MVAGRRRWARPVVPEIASVLVAIFLCICVPPANAFSVLKSTCSFPSLTSCSGVSVSTAAVGRSNRMILSSSTTDQSGRSDQGEGSADDQTRQRKKDSKAAILTLSELSQRVKSNPAKFLDNGGKSNVASNAKGGSSSKKRKNKRTRQRVESPQQTYLYRSQRLALLQQQSPRNATSRSDSSLLASNTSSANDNYKNVIAVARSMGMVASTQHCFSDLEEQPHIVGRVAIGDETVESPSACFAFVVHKPPGWSILGSSGGSGGGGSTAAAATSNAATLSTNSTAAEDASSTLTTGQSMGKSKSQHKKRIKIVEPDGSTDVLEYSELDVMALLSPEELDEYLADVGGGMDTGGLAREEVRSRSRDAGDDEADDNDDDDDDDDDHEASPVVEITTLVEEQGSDIDADMDPVRAANLQRIAARMSASEALAGDGQPTQLVPAPRPSVVAWLKDNAGEKHSIRGGTYWTAVVGATRVDDSGLVLLAPKHKVQDVNVNAVEYLAVVGTGDYLAKTSSKDSDKPKEVEFEVVSRLRKGRSEDTVHVVKVRSTNPSTSCSSIIAVCQEEFEQGIRGDPEANPFDRRASRRLLHCHQMSVSSNMAGVSIFESASVPLDIAILLERGQPTKKLFTAGSFLGRASLRNSTATNAYREINSAADGYPGWTVDRYDKWLYVQHDPQKSELGPLPSIHDGYTAGVYLLEQSSPDRSTDGSIRPTLLEGRAAPERFPVLENGITYLVSLQDLSTGIFLDQRPQRSWLARNCQPGTRVLNCFAHAGAYSVAAATASASTVSIDLSRKWLERLPDQLAANGIPFDERHDAIYGDCFDWLGRLAKRGEKYDIVILDPPSSSVGGRKKRRWSIKNDMDELVALAAGLVKKGGWLWTTTNSASIHPVKFARLCKKGLDDAGIPDAKLERVQPMPEDFPTIGPQAVKNLVWRIP